MRDIDILYRLKFDEGDSKLLDSAREIEEWLKGDPWFYSEVFPTISQLAQRFFP